MSEDRTQAPSTRRRLEARERGQVARSPELTGAAGLLAATALLGIWGDDLVLALLGLIREPWASGDLGVSTMDIDHAVERIRQAAWGIFGPLLGILGGTLAASVAAHQAQVGGLFVPGLIAPDFARVWKFGGGGGGDDEFNPFEGLAARASKGAWSVAKAVVVAVVAGWLIRSDLNQIFHLNGMETRAMAHTAAGLLRSTAFSLALATLVLGLVDFALQYQRFEAMMRLTPDQQREDLRAADGDPAMRSRRRRQAQALRGDAPELLAGATLAVLGASGLVVILGGGPPPRKVTIRSSANGATGRKLIRSADAANLAILDAPSLALALARLRTPLVPPELATELTAAWPAD